MIPLCGISKYGKESDTMHTSFHRCFLMPIKVSTALSVLLCAFLLSGCSRTASPVSQTGFYLDTVVTITLYDTGIRSSDADCEQTIEACFSLIDAYEHLFSATLEDSDIWKINHSGGRPVTVSDDTVSLLQSALHYAELTDGRVDPTVRPLSELWNFGSEGGAHVPDQSAVTEALSHVDYHTVRLEGNTVTLQDPHAAIDPGFIAKGYIADRLKEYLLSQGVESACISLGGNVIAIGSKPDGQPYRIGIQKPFAAGGETVTAISMTDASVVSSGIYERYFYEDDILYHHLLDTQTGYPADTNIAGVTILAPTSVEADALSTTCYFLGMDAGMELIESLDGVEALFILTDGTLHRSGGFPAG